MRWIRRAWPAIVWAAVIAFFSTHYFTDQNTGRIIFPLLHWLFPHRRFFFYLRADHFIRKGAHVTEYFIFSLILLHTIRGERKGWRIAWAVFAILTVFGYACTDELHQTFVPGRGPAFTDVMLDTFAGALAQAVAWLWFAARAKNVPRAPAE
ncbi:MAG TPA: VanZ family protein [Candidatus Acidoferrales bacterium]|nr:VanZ family protein [Candidatus Acidoferrales bacterium]